MVHVEQRPLCTLEQDVAATGEFIPARALMNDRYCLKCHADIHAGWYDSVHHFSSFNNPVYLASVRAGTAHESVKMSLVK